ncbi:MAG: N-acetyltransferase [Actinomycetota bacterium]|nr:N-acetyltransferase [Actinomycetota bacterium]
MAEITIANDREQHRYVIACDGAQVGWAQYREQPGELIVTHAEIDAAVGGQGLGSRLVAFLLQDARDRDLDVVPLCPFVRDYIARHPEDRDLVPEERRAALGL